MNLKGKGLLLAAGALGSILAASPVLAQSHGGGHFSGGGGAHFGGGGGGGVRSAPSAHFGGGAHYAAPGRGFAAGSYAGGGLHGYGGRAATSTYYHGYTGRPTGAGHYFAGRPDYASGGRYSGYWQGYSTGAYWRGGYWGGGYWPRCYYGADFAWFLPVLPLAYATYWWGGTPYYYANDVYYTYSPDYSGYVATDPPPVRGQESGGTADSSGYLAPPSGSAEVFMYPKNGQSAEQQTQDRSECQAWAAQQAGSPAQNGSDYRRAMVACVEGRGYSAK